MISIGFKRQQKNTIVNITMYKVTNMIDCKSYYMLNKLIETDKSDVEKFSVTQWTNSPYKNKNESLGGVWF